MIPLVYETAELLGLDWNEHIVQSNDHLYVRHLGIDRKAVFERLQTLPFLFRGDNTHISATNAKLHIPLFF